MDVQTVFETPWFAIRSLRSDSCADGKPYYRFDMPDGVVILPVTRQGHIVLIRQFRPAQGRITTELPAGMVEKGEDPVEAGLRELYEETGYRSGQTVVLGQGVVRLERERACNTFLLALDCERDPNFVAAEQIEVCPMPPDEFRTLVMDGGFDHVVGLAVVQMAQWRHGLEI